MVGLYARRLLFAPRTRTQITSAYRRRRYWLTAASTMDWSNCTHSIFTKMRMNINLSAVVYFHCINIQM